MLRIRLRVIVFLREVRVLTVERREDFLAKRFVRLLPLDEPDFRLAYAISV